MREKKTKGKSGDAGPAVVSCWPLYEIMDFFKGNCQKQKVRSRLISTLSMISALPMFIFLQHFNQLPSESGSCLNICYCKYHCT